MSNHSPCVRELVKNGLLPSNKMPDLFLKSSLAKIHEAIKSKICHFSTKLLLLFASVVHHFSEYSLTTISLIFVIVFLAHLISSSGACAQFFYLPLTCEVNCFYCGQFLRNFRQMKKFFGPDEKNQSSSGRQIFEGIGIVSISNAFVLFSFFPQNASFSPKNIYYVVFQTHIS